MFDYDVVVIGSGPGGYVSAIRASQLGLKVAIVEREKVGGVCLNVGCIPSKSLIHSASLYNAISRLKDFGVKVDISEFNYKAVVQKSRDAANTLSLGVKHLLKKNKVSLFFGQAQIINKNTVSINEGSEKLSTENILIATGSRPRELPNFPLDGKRIISSTDMLLMEELPSSLVVLGAGAIGIEMASVMNTFGVDVTIVEMQESLLPREDEDVVTILQESFLKRGIEIYTGARAEEVKEEGTLLVKMSNGTMKILPAEKILLAIGRSPNSQNLGLENLGIHETNGFIDTEDYYETNIKGIYSIGDVINTPQLAHVASKEGEIAVEKMAGRSPASRISEDTIPSAIYCNPQIAGFGFSEQHLIKTGVAYRKAVFPFRGVGKAVAMEDSDGLFKILIDERTNEIISAFIVGPDATELIHELLLAKNAELFCEDIASMIHAHPTISEGIMEAARAADNWAIHI